MKRSVFSSLSLAVVVAVAFALWLSMTAYNAFRNDMNDRYAGMHAGYMIADYIVATKQWPRSWDDLKQHDERLNDPKQWEDMQQRIKVDWSADLAELQSAASSISPPFPVVTSNSGRTPGPTQQHEANYVIYETLRDLNIPADVPDSTPDTTSGSTPDTTSTGN